MTKVKVYKNKMGDFQKSVIEIDDESLLSIFISGILQEIREAERIINHSKSNEYLIRKYQKQFDRLEELLIQFNNPKIVRNEYAEIKRKFEEMKEVYEKDYC